jgi:hypothetical protein
MFSSTYLRQAMVPDSQSSSSPYFSLYMLLTLISCSKSKGSTPSVLAQSGSLTFASTPFTLALLPKSVVSIAKLAARASLSEAHNPPSGVCQ